ncbi:MAG: hypothetical protein ACFFDU_02895 [Candidatus Thorarchaeota archaeon]
MSTLNQIRLQSLRNLRPTKSELDSISTIFNTVKKAVKLEVEERGIDIAFIELEGSSGRKQTQLRNWKELDIFVGLPVSAQPESLDRKVPSKSSIRRLLKKMVKDVAVSAATQVQAEKIQIAYAEHPYLIAQIDDYQVEIVFCFDLTKEYILKNGPITAVDRTPHHSNFVQQNLTDRQRDDVRLLKAFFQSSFVYGDSSPIGRSGFTGFSAEMLIFHMQTIEAALEFLSQPEPEPLDFFNRASDFLKTKFSHDFFIISDPIDPNRNIASSISERAYRFSAHQAHHLLQHPTMKFFERQPVPQLQDSELELLEPHYFVIEFHDQTGWHYTKTRDKIYRYFSKLSRFLKQEPTGEPRFGQVIFEELFHEDIFAVALYIENVEISKSYIRIGPSLDYLDGVKRFLEKHPNGFLKNGRYYIETKREFVKAEQALRYFLSRNQISSKIVVSNISRCGTTRIGKQALWILTQSVQPFIKSD